MRESQLWNYNGKKKWISGLLTLKDGENESRLQTQHFWEQISLEDILTFLMQPKYLTWSYLINSETIYS